MHINPSSIKYIEWRSPEGLHEDTITCLSELRFLKSEISFLSDLIKSHTLDLLSENLFEESRIIAVELSKQKKRVKPLIKNLMDHSNTLQTLLDDIDIPDEEDEYKTAHYQLMFESVACISNLKKLKRRVFRLIKKILKEKKKRKLLRPGEKGPQ
jgi:gas vesicle protein